MTVAAIALAAAAHGADVDLQMTAKKFAFEPKVIKVRQGDHVKLVITALDHDHGFKLEAFQIDELLKKGQRTTIEFTADKAGTYPFACSHYCGLGHRGMKGELVVESAN